MNTNQAINLLLFQEQKRKALRVAKALIQASEHKHLASQVTDATQFKTRIDCRNSKGELIATIIEGTVIP